MKPLLSVLLLSAFLLFPINAPAQRRRAARRPAGAITKPTPTPAANPVLTPAAAAAVRRPVAPVPLAIVNAQTITTADLDPRIRNEVESLEEKIAQTRREMLDVQINTILLELEARKRRLTTQQLYNLEVSKRIVQPTPSDITRFIEENREQIGTGDEATIRRRVADLLRSAQASKLQEEFVLRLRRTNPVGTGVDINTTNLSATAVVATIAGQPLTAGPLLEKLKPAIFKLRVDTYELEKADVDRIIFDLLVIAEANRRNVAPEVVKRTEISEKVRRPTDAEVAKFYAENSKEIGGDLSAVHNQLAEFLENRDQARLERELNEKLRKGADVRILLQEPEAPKQMISVDDDPSRGDSNAPVTVVEFTDFQCPACAAMHPILEEVLKSYGNKVRFVVRDFPLPIHANSRKAAEAANAAHQQGKFFEYAALLFKRQDSLDVSSLKKYATEVGLDRARFDAALDKGTFAEEVQRDLIDAETYGVESTPTIFVNGVVLGTLSSEALRTAIDRALSGK